ncbi:hypothetical protein B0H19DRAFT_957235 [Mycena capillaripes]|nr:hypothetical protein B0H19DRAFT_957235 [Mycena capillaripes]
MAAKEQLLQRIKVKKRQEADSARLVQKVIDTLHGVRWSGWIQGFDTQAGVVELTLYTGRDWFTDIQQSHMLDLLRADILAEGKALEDDVAEIWLMECIKLASKNRHEYDDPTRHTRARTMGNALASGERSRIGLSGNLSNVHWISAVVDGKEEQILYGDSFKSVEPAPEIREALSWWTKCHTGKIFTWGRLQISRQQDGFNCGLLSHNGLAHHFLPKKYPLVETTGSIPAADARLQMMLRVVNRQLDASYFPSVTCRRLTCCRTDMQCTDH